jgi:hypothetical protein
LLDDPEWNQWSNKEIARICRVSDTLVASIRRPRSKELRRESRKFLTRHGTVGRRPVKTRKTPVPAITSDAEPVGTEPDSPTPDQEPSSSDESAGFDDATDDAGSDFADDGAERRVRSAIAAAEAVVALGDKLASVTPEFLNRLLITFRNLIALWRKLFPAKNGTAPSASASKQLKD